MTLTAVVDGVEILRENWKSFKRVFGFTSVSISHLMREAGNNYSRRFTVYVRHAQ